MSLGDFTQNTFNQTRYYGQSSSDDEAAVNAAVVGAKRKLLIPKDQLGGKKRKLVTPLSPPRVEYSDSDSDSEPRRQSVSAIRRSSFAHTHRRKKSVLVPESDSIARQKCFDYLVQAIDEAWAMYCLQTSSYEQESYGHELPSSPVSLCDEGYGSETELRRQNSASSQPESQELVQLRTRMLNAKYFLQDLVEKNDPESSAAFWHRWDMVKYCTIELVEDADQDDDDDDLVEQVIDELEDGRHYSLY